MVGGTSIGSAFAATYALMLSPDEALEKVEEILVRGKAFGKLTVPIYSFIEHKHFESKIRGFFSDIDIEDLPINYYAATTSLTQNDLHVMRTGPVWQAVRSSCSIPGVLPPFIKANGEVLIDGAVIDNIPVDAMRSLKPGQNVVLNLPSTSGWKVKSDYKKLPGRWGVLKGLFFPWTKPRSYFPGIFSILNRAMIVNAARRFSLLDKQDDIFLVSKTLRGMSLFSWKKGREQFELSYQQMCMALEAATGGSRDGELEMLRQAASKLRGNEHRV